MENKSVATLLEFNIAVFLISTSGPLGKYVSMPPAVTIWWRCLVAALILGLFCKWKKIDLSFNVKKDGFAFILGAILLGGHWITYFYALAISNVAIAMLSLFTYPVITALLEPLLLKNRYNPLHLILGSIVLVGIYFLAPEFSLENSATVGVVFGLISAVFYALRNILMKVKVSKYSGSMLMFYQLLLVSVLLWPVLLIQDTSNITTQWPVILMLAVVTTSIGHTLFVRSFRHFSISTASIMSSSQPVYGILLGIVFLNEIPGWSTILGGSLIILTVIIESLSVTRNSA